MKQPERALVNGEKTGIASVSKKPKAALSTVPDAGNFYHTVPGINVGKPFKIFRFITVYHKDKSICIIRTNYKS